MVGRRKVQSTRQSRRVSREMRDSTIGTHVQRSSSSQRRPVSGSSTSARSSRRGAHGSSATYSPVTSSEDGSRRQRGQQRNYVETIQGRARSRRIGAIVIVVVVLIAVALLAGFLAFRGTVGSKMALQNSNAADALVSVRSDEPYYALIAVELGATAEPLEHAGPDVLLLARVDREKHQLALVNIPSGLQVATDSGARRIADLASSGDAALINAVSNFAKVDISHYVKVPEGGVQGIVDVLGGIDVNIDQVIDDPHAGDVYIPEGAYTLNSSSAITYLRADNLKLGVNDQLDHQVTFAALLLEKLFSAEGNFATRLDSIDDYFQTDLTLGDIETLQSWLRDVPASSITCVSLPGYITEVTGVVNTGDALFVGSSDSMAQIIEALEKGEEPTVGAASTVQAAAPSSFTVEVQNGTDIAGAASISGDLLKSKGFNVTAVGNAEQQVYNETLVVYKNAEGQGPARAQAVIEALGLGRAISGDMYYQFESDVLLIVGYDYKPFV